MGSWKWELSFQVVTEVSWLARSLSHPLKDGPHRHLRCSSQQKRSCPIPASPVGEWQGSVNPFCQAGQTPVKKQSPSRSQPPFEGSGDARVPQASLCLHENHLTSSSQPLFICRLQVVGNRCHSLPSVTALRVVRSGPCALCWVLPLPGCLG